MTGIMSLIFAVLFAIASTVALVITVQNCEPECLFYAVFGYVMTVVFIIMFCR